MGRDFPKLTLKTDADGESALAPTGWEQRFYKISPEPFRFKKLTLAFSDDLFVEDNFLLEGSIRVEGRLAPGRLQICLIESDEYKLLGYSANGQLQTISYDGSQWDVVGRAPGRATTLNVSSRLVEKIVPPASAAVLNERMGGKEKAQALVLPMTSQADWLLRTIRQCFQHKHFVDAEDSDRTEIGWISEDLIGAASALIDEILDHEKLAPGVGASRRREIAKQVEAGLWLKPSENAGASLDDFVERLNCSRRLIQLAVSETFGMGFVELKRLIRLHQANQTLKTRARDARITDLAFEHGFENSGRFASYYRDFFGFLPKEARRD